MIKQISVMAVSVTILSACSSFQASEPSIGTLGDESTIAKHHFHDGSSVMVEDIKPMNDNHSAMHNDMMQNDEMSSDNHDVNVMHDMSYIRFSFDSASLSAEARSQLATIADKLRTSTSNNIVVEGHADERGTREYNLALGDRRAVAIKKYLVGLGVPSNKLTTISYGKERPKNPAHTEEAWSENRRGVVNVK